MAALHRRLAFPIFCFLIAEGCVYTRDRRKYALRLLVFALLSEVPFDLMVGGTVWYPYSQNVLWTLLAGALICWCVDWALRKKTPGGLFAHRRGRGRRVLPAGAGRDGLSGLGYAAGGAVLRCPPRVLRHRREANGAGGGTGGVQHRHYGGVSIELWSLAALLPLWLYNGRRGYSNRAVQYGFYAFYPVHILILSLIALYA